MIDIENELNGRQAEAVRCTDGPQMVIAGAGSGKTRVLTYRIAYLLEMGVEPWSVLALTFTNKAAGEMKDRIASKVGQNRAKYLWMGTFHSIFSRILHAEAEQIGFSQNFTVYDQSDSQSLIRSIIKEMQLDDKVYKPNVIQNRISNAKNRLYTPADYLQNADILKNDQYRSLSMCGQIYKRYWERCHQADAMDFDDLLLYTYLLFRQNEEVRARYASRFRYVLVDEYQDTNYAQHCIVWQLTRDTRNVCVVGDDAQSIYSFRGANIDNMLKFTQLYPEAQMFKLEQNYRSTQTIVEAANSLIAKNRNQIRKNVFSENEKGSQIEVFQVQSDIAEANTVAEKIYNLYVRDDVNYGDIAVLYRTNAQSRVFEEAFRSQGIPYKIYGSLSFYQRKEIKDVIAYMRLVVNHNDEEAFKRIINTPARGIGATTLGRIADAANANNISFWEVITHLDEYGREFNSGTTSKLSQFAGLIGGFEEKSRNTNAYELAVQIVETSGLLRELASDHTPEGKERSDNVQELMNGIDSFCRGRMEEDDERLLLTDFLNEVSLMTDQDNDKEGDDRKVTLMTVHAAKGLEFDSVFIVGMEDNLFPSQMCVDDERQLEEERRLFYVAITRAKHRCTLTFSKCRFRYGNMEMPEPSRFLRDIDSKYMNVHLLQTLSKPRLSLHNPDFDDVFGGDESAGEFASSGRRFGFREEREPYAERQFKARNQGSCERSFSSRQVSSGNTVEPSMSRPRNLKRVSELIGNQGGSSAQTVSLSAGNIIEHERFGRGTVLSVEGSGDASKARIRFDTAGEKTLLLKFARYTVIG